jgi:hypothetical protein
MKRLRWFPSPPAEIYAKVRYRRGLRSWRRWIRWRLLPVLAPVFLVAVVWGIGQHHNAAFFAGMIAGASATMFLAFREFAPAYVENWGQGSEGELKTHNALATLGWVLVDDVDTGHGNYDHLLVGPPGVFMIETKNLTGITEIRGGVAWLRRRHDPDGDQPQTRLQPTVLGASAEVSRAIRERTRRHEWVRAIVVSGMNSLRGSSRRTRSPSFTGAGSGTTSMRSHLGSTLRPKPTLAVYFSN